jgi:hypothetical protein
MYGEELSFIQYLSNKILQQHPLEEINYKRCQELEMFHNIFFANKRINSRILETVIHEEGIEQVYILGKKTRIKLPNEVKKYLIRI